MPMSNDETTPNDDDLQVETYDVDNDGKVGLIDGYRATLGLVDAELEMAAEEADHKGVKGRLADAAHKIVDKLDND